MQSSRSHWKSNFQEVGRKNHRRRRRIKKHSRTSPDVQFKEFSWTKQKTRPKTDYERIGKTISKKSDQKTKRQNAARENKKPLARNVNLILTKKLGLKWTMNGLEKPFRKKSDPKNWKNQNAIAACEQKTTSEKANFCSNTVFFFFKIRAKKIHATKALAFSLQFLFRHDQNYYSNLTSKIMKMCKQILKTAPQCNSNSLNYRNHDVPSNTRYRSAAIN